MSILITSQAWAYSKSSGSTLLVILAIADFANDDGFAFPSVETLAAKSRSSERTVQYALRELIALGELSIQRGAGPHGCNLYQVRVQNLRGANSAGVQPGSFGGATHCTQTIIEPSKKKKESAGAKKSPIDFDKSNGEFTGITDQQRAMWAKAYPDINVTAELTRSACWLIANPEREKKLMGRFITNWLTRAQERAQAGRTASEATHTSTKPSKTRQERSDEWRDFLKNGFNPSNAGQPGQSDHGGGDVIDVPSKRVE